MNTYPSTKFTASVDDILKVHLQRGPASQNVEVYTTFGGRLGTLDEGRPPRRVAHRRYTGTFIGRRTGAGLNVTAPLSTWTALGVEVEA